MSLLKQRDDSFDHPRRRIAAWTVAVDTDIELIKLFASFTDKMVPLPLDCGPPGYRAKITQKLQTAGVTALL